MNEGGENKQLFADGVNYKFDRLPARLDFGLLAVCPRCKGRTAKFEFDGMEGKRHRDPYRDGKRKPCQGCNGWGIVPNVGAIPMTPPEGLK